MGASETLKAEYHNKTHTVDFEMLYDAALNKEQREKHRCFYLLNGYRETGLFLSYLSVDYEVFCYDKYVNTTMGASAVANYLNEHGYVKKKRQGTGVKSEKIYNQEHENIISSILRCPVCGAAMYGNVNRKKKKDGTLYKDYYYHCKYRTTVNGHRCGYKRQWKQEIVNAAVEEVIRKLVTNPKFEQAIRQKIGSRIYTDELETELEQLRKKLRQLNVAKSKLGQQMDSLGIYNMKQQKISCLL